MALAFDYRRAPRPLWHSEKDEELRKLWAEGLSASRIADKMGGGLTRSAILGRVYRLRLAGRQTNNPELALPVIQALWIDGYTAAEISKKLNCCTQTVHKKLKALKLQPRRAYEKRVKINPVTGLRTPFIQAPLPVPALNASDIPVSQRKTLMELEACHCRWPYNHPNSEDFFFCGSPTADLTRGRPYCADHTRASTNNSHYIPWGFR